MNVVHIVPTFYPATYWGGPIYSVYGLCNSLARIAAVRLRVLTTDSAGPKLRDTVTVSGFPASYPSGYEVYMCRRWWAATFSPSMLLRLWPMIRWADVVHLTGVYSPPTIPALLICRVLGRPVVWSPRGALQRWGGATKPLLKKWWEWICNALIIREHCLLHVTSEQEMIDSRARIANAGAVVIPNGVDIPEILADRSWRPEGKLRLLYLGRLHPIKGIENLLRALEVLADPTISLSVCGSGEEKYSEQLQHLTSTLGLKDSVTFHGHVDGVEKWNAFMQADLCVVPSFSENFGMVVAEALAHAVPVISSKGTPWRELEKHGCGLWVDNSPQALSEAIATIRTLDLPTLGNQGRRWMQEHFSLERTALRMFAAYKQVAPGAG